MQDKKIKCHLWGIKKAGKKLNSNSQPSSHFQSWEYIRECLNDRSAIRGIDSRLYSQLEIREEDSGKVVKAFVTEDD